MKPQLDPVIHQATRLRLMSVLIHLEPGDWVDFTGLKKELGLTDGNLGAQLLKLEEARYARIKKDFVGRRPRTRAQATARGRAAFQSHREALLKIIDDTGGELP